MSLRVCDDALPRHQSQCFAQDHPKPTVVNVLESGLRGDRARSAWSASTLPAPGGRTWRGAGYQTSLALFGIGATVLGLIGPLLLGIAVIRAKVFPSLVGILLMVAGVLSPVTTFSSGVLFALIGLVGIVSAAIAYGWVGMSLTKQQNATEAKVPSSGQPALR